MQSRQALSSLTLGAIGVVFGDIGTSPLYALKEIFNGHHPIPVTPDNILGILSMVVWSIVLLVTLKYVSVIMRADNRGEGGSLALLSLITERAKIRVLAWVMTARHLRRRAVLRRQHDHPGHLGAVGGGGPGDHHPRPKPYVLPLTVGILSGLFFIQRRGTGTVGLFFGPVMIGWFGVLGCSACSRSPAPDVLAALNPIYAIRFIGTHPGLAFLALGSVVLAVTGGEACTPTWATSAASRSGWPGSAS
jgi:KUP system potassium uptake protein